MSILMNMNFIVLIIELLKNVFIKFATNLLIAHWKFIRTETVYNSVHHYTPESNDNKNNNSIVIFIFWFSCKLITVKKKDYN